MVRTSLYATHLGAKNNVRHFAAQICQTIRMLCQTGATLVALALLAIATACQAQSPTFNPIPAIRFDTTGPVIRAHAETEKPFTVAGEHGVILGQQNGTFEAWVLPVKLLSHLTIEADIEGYSVPIDVNQQAAEIEVRPDRTVITYSHIGFTVRQIMFSPNDSSLGTGPIVLYEFDCLHPADFIFRFTPNLEWMWPERNEGVPGIEWVAGPNAAPTGKEPGPSGTESGTPLPNHGYYVLHSDYPNLAGAITIPGAQPGILAPYQERPQVHPVEFHLHIDPARDRGRLFPLLMAAGMNKESATNAALGAALEKLNQTIAERYKTHDESWNKLLANSVSIETPDKSLNEAFQWAEISIEQLKAHPVDAQSIPTGESAGAPGPDSGTGDNETALVAGYYASGDSARPGFGWFFGRDSLYTLYAVNGYGDFALSKSELEFLIRRQREDGKIMHEYSQTAAAIDWRAFPYMYAAADSTPLFLLAAADYVKSSGDVAFLTTHRDSIEKAWAFETDPAHDTDHDGIYDNSQGTGWVESWPGAMPHQEIYLALLDQQASSAMSYLEGLLKDSEKSAAAQTRADKLAKTINAEYRDPQKNCYAFSRNLDGSQDRTSTIYPALAWWDPAGGKSILTQPEGCLSQFAAASLNTDWGLRDVANTEPIYDGMSYHQGSVWPLFTGWAALAEYRGGQPLAGYQLLMENANLTQAQDLGAVTELLSGDFNVPFGRSTSHQLWSSAMVITPILRGLFGISIDAQTKTITVNPHLPAEWPRAEVRNIQVPGGTLGLSFNKEGETLIMFLKQSGVNSWKVHTDSHNAKPDKIRPSALDFSLNPVRITFLDGRLAAAGARTSITRVIHEEWNTRTAVFQVEGLAGTSADFLVSQRDWKTPALQVSGGLSNHAESGKPGALLTSLGIGDPVNAPPFGSELQINFPPGEGWKTITVTLTW
jgi:glycogen debranching enzyme